MNPKILVCFAVPEEAAPFRRLAVPGVDILVTGMGRANAERAFLARLELSLPELVLTCGFAGGLDPALPADAVVFAEDEGAGLKGDLLQSGAVAGRIHCAERVAVTVAEKTALRKTTMADAVDMESEAIRNLCHSRNIRSATIRVISDTANEALPLDFNAFMTADYKLSFARLAGKLLISPGKIPALMQLQKRTQSAARRLATVLADLLRRRVGGG